MAAKLPGIIKRYVAASNKRDVKSALACLLDDAVVRNDGETLHGKEATRGWIVKTARRHKFHFKPLNVKNRDPDIVVKMEVSGTFDGSPFQLDFDFLIEHNKISTLIIR